MLRKARQIQLGMKRWDIGTFLRRGLELIQSVGGVGLAGSAL